MKWNDGCNSCSCQEDDSLLCTIEFCEGPEDCSPGQGYFSGGSWCFCHSDRTKDLCLNLGI